jgi:hypothetical protein
MTAVLLGALALLCGVAQADKGLNDGAYRDREGKDHRWSIERSHVLTWEGTPYTPAGVVFHSAYLGKPGAETLKRDEAELERLRGAGILDIWIDPGTGLLENSPQETQKLIDAVETRGFRYGLRVGDRFRAPLVGFSPILPITRVPASKLVPNGEASWEIRAPRSRRVTYALVESSANERTLGVPIASGEVVVEGDTAQIAVKFRNSRRLGKSRGLLYAIPEIQVEPEELGSFGDLWEGMEKYNARLRQHFSAVKFGSGLRFILDPFSAGDGTVGQEDLVFPSSEEFRTAFAEWLSKRGGTNTLNQRWRTNDRTIGSFEEAARLVPTWSRNDPPEGDGWLLDPVDKVAYRCLARQSTIWKDLDDFRAETLKKWMNVSAINLEHDGLNIPVLFTWSSYHPLFNNSPSPSGYDGLAAQLYGAPENVAQNTGGYALAQVEESDRNSWLVALRLAGAASSADQPAPVTDLAQGKALWRAARDVGMRGVYFDPEQTPNAVELAREVASGMSADLEAMNRKIPICFFPMVMSSADRLMRLSNGVWWLPSAANARMLRYGDSIQGYEMPHPLGDEHPVQNGTVLWSTSGTQEVSFYLGTFGQVALYDSSGAALKPRIKKGQLQVTLSSEPLIAAGVEATSLFPIELAVEHLKEFDDLLRQAEAKKADTASLRVIYKEAEKNLSPANAPLVYNAISPYVASLRQTLTPFIWIEAERPVAHNFSGAAFRAGASSGAYLKLDRREAPVSGVFRARYAIDVLRDGSYDIWVAGKVPGRPGVSPLTWQVDDEPANSLDKADAVGADFAGGMAWFQLGRATLQAGRHELTLVTPRRAPGENQRFVAGFDAIVLSREPFHPNGSEKQYGMGRTSRVANEKSKPGATPPPNELLPEKTEKPDRSRKATPKKPEAQPEKPPAAPTEKSAAEPEDFKVAPPREGVGGAIIDVDEKTGRRLPTKDSKDGKKGKKGKESDKNAPSGAPSADPMR